MDKWTNGQTRTPHLPPQAARAEAIHEKVDVRRVGGARFGPRPPGLFKAAAAGAGLRAGGGGRGVRGAQSVPGSAEHRPTPSRSAWVPLPPPPPQPGAASAATSCLCCVPCPGEWALPEGGGRGMAAVPSRGAALTGGAWGPFGRPLPREEARQARGAVRGAVRGRWRRF